MLGLAITLMDIDVGLTNTLMIIDVELVVTLMSINVGSNRYIDEHRCGRWQLH